ncbi:MAG: pitrilysin family protein [Phycisphaerales bacterium]
MESIQTRTLDSGLVLLVEPMGGVKSAALTWAIPAGAASDPEDRQGLSAMWQELLLRGAGDLDSRASADALDRVGASRSCSVGMHYLYLTMTLVGERVVEALPLAVDMVRRPRFDAASIEPVRDLCVQALESLEDEPQKRAALAARARHYATPLDRSGMGTEEGLAAVTREDVVERWGERAVPQGSVLAIAGAVDAGQIEARLKPLLAGWEGAADQIARGPAPARGYAHEDDESNQVQIYAMFDAPTEKSDHARLERAAAAVLSGGMSGRLFTEVREKRALCYSVSASYSTDRDNGTLSAYVGTTPERAQESLDVLWSELHRLTTPAGRVTPEEFQRAVIGMKSRLIFSGESTGARSSALVGDYVRLGRARALSELIEQIDSLTLDEVNAYLAKRTLGTATVQTLGPAGLKMP